MTALFVRLEFVSETLSSYCVMWDPFLLCQQKNPTEMRNFTKIAFARNNCLLTHRGVYSEVRPKFKSQIRKINFIILRICQSDIPTTVTAVTFVAALRPRPRTHLWKAGKQRQRTYGSLRFSEHTENLKKDSTD